MESVEEAIAHLRIKIAETEKIKRRQETELAELTQVLEDIQRHTRETTRLTLEKFQADEQVYLQVGKYLSFKTHDCNITLIQTTVISRFVV